MGEDRMPASTTNEGTSIDLVSTRALLMDAYNSCAMTAEAMGAPSVATKIRELAFTIEGKELAPGVTAWLLPRIATE